MNHEGTIEDFETQIKELQAKIDAIKERKAVWTPKVKRWRLSPDLRPCFNDGYVTKVGGTYATREDAVAAIPLRRRQQLLEAYKREFDPAFKPKFNGSQANYYPIYLTHGDDVDNDDGRWIAAYDRARRDPQRTYFSGKGVTDLVEKLNNGTVVLELGT